MLSNNTEVVISGFGESEYPNIPTFQEITTLEKSLSMIEEYLKAQRKYDKCGYLFAINRLEDADFLYSYLNGTVQIAGKYKENGLLCNIIHQEG